MLANGWSQGQNGPLECGNIITQNGELFLVDKTERQFEVKVKSFATDNTGNLEKITRKENLHNTIWIVCYVLNLLAQMQKFLQRPVTL